MILLIAVSNPLRTCCIQARRRVQQLEEKLLELELQDESEVRLLEAYVDIHAWLQTSLQFTLGMRMLQGRVFG